MDRLARGDGSFYERYRPRKFDELVPTFKVKALQKQVATGGSRSFLFHGPSGTGKTTSARLLSLLVNCNNEETKKLGEPCLECDPCRKIQRGACVDIYEIDGADKRKIDDIRALRGGAHTMPFEMKRKVYIIDEAHRLTDDAQDMLFKWLEDSIQDIYIILCTSEFNKVRYQIRTRCYNVQFRLLSTPNTIKFVSEVAKKEHPEGHDLPLEMAKKIAMLSQGSARHALVNLEQFFNGGLESAIPEKEEPQTDFVKQVARALLESDWSKVTQYMKGADIDPENFRIGICNYSRAVLLNAGTGAKAKKAYHILSSMEDTIPSYQRDGYNKVVAMLYRAANVRV